ncbi:MAG: hypothetical protein CMF39_04165 [Legionellaceae bacterium]|nr:hypothetical protein [Legionellaceae bacterium]
MINQITKKLAVITSLSIALLVGSSAMAVNTPAVSNRPIVQEPNTMLVLLAKSGVIHQHGHAYQLTLSGVDPRTLWFTDRPVRMAGFDLTREFIAHWHQAFSTSAPNAVLVHMDSGLPPHGQPLAVELTHPVVHQGKLTFTLQPLNNAPVHTGNLRYPVLFIDSIWGDIEGGLTEGAGYLITPSDPTAGALLVGAGKNLIHPPAHVVVPVRTMQNVNIKQLVNNADAPITTQQKALQTKANTAKTNSLAAYHSSVDLLKWQIAQEQKVNTIDHAAAIAASAEAAKDITTTHSNGFLIPHDSLSF